MKRLSDLTHEKISEKAFTQCLAISVLGILLCIVSLCSATYAWFSTSVACSQNTLVAGSFRVAAVEVETVSAGASGTVDGPKYADGVWTCTLPAGGTYRVIIDLENESTAKGRCVVKIGGIDGPSFNTAPIIGANTADPDYKAPGKQTDPFTFTIDTTGATNDVEVTFTPLWGVAANPDIANEATCSYNNGNWIVSPALTN